MKFTIFVFSIFLALALCPVWTTGKVAKFGEPCKKETHCNAEGFLQCISNVCQCVKPELVYDESKGICIALPGDSCKYENLETKKGEPFPEEVKCDHHSFCGENGTCVCDPDFILSTNKSCIPNRIFGEECSVDSDGNHNCRPDKFLQCIDGKCGCEDLHAIYDHTREECVAREGASCIAYQNCVPNAACPFRHTGNYYSSTLCVCTNGFTRSHDGLCLANFGEPCNTSDKKCGHDMMCKSGRCECRFAERQKYDRDLNKCLSFVDSPCLVKYKGDDGKSFNITFPCVKNAECKQIEALHECRCKEGYIEGEHNCELSYNQTCGDHVEEPCDRLAPLECIDGQCKCSSEYLYYEVNTRKCKALVGAPCLLGMKNWCTGGSECRSSRNSNSKYGQCRCSQGYHTTAGRKCIHHLLIRGDSKFF